MLQQFNATRCLPIVKDSKRRRQRRFSAFFSFNSSQQFLGKRMHSSAFVLMLGSARARGGRIFHAAITFATRTNANRKNNTMKFFFSDQLKTFRSLLTVKSSNATLTRRCPSPSTTYDSK